MAGLDIGLAIRRAQESPLPTSSSGADFVAVDFETANSARSSACAVGVAVVRDGRVTEHGSTLINPETEFSPYNTAVTGIGPAEVATAPRFDEVWPKLRALLDGQILIAHVAHFDLGVLRQSVSRYKLPGIHARALCSWRLARQVWPTLPSYGLSFLSQQLGLDLEHHEAGSDAAVAAGIVIQAAKSMGASDLDSLRAQVGFSYGRLIPSSFEGVDSGALTHLHNAAANPDADPDHPLYGRSICFTGAMYSMPRREAAERIVGYGASFKNGMSASVDMLVIGDADFAQFADGLRTGKMKKAAELKADGHDIEIIAEREFLSMLGD